jgi:hypothetical protein
MGAPRTALSAGRVVLAISPRRECRLVPPCDRVGQEVLEVRGLRLVKLVHGGFDVVVANLHMSSGRIQPSHQDPPHLQKLRSLGLIELKVNEAEQEVDVVVRGHGRGGLAAV